jgi:hypothetical protein
MAMDTIVRGSTSGTGAEVAGTNQLKVIPEVDVSTLPENVGGVKIYGENDDGGITGLVRLRSPEVDVDYRQRASLDLLLEEDVFNYVAQNTGKHTYANTTMTATWTAGQITTNATSITTTTTGVSIGSYAYFPNQGTQTLSIDMEAAFSAQPVINTIIDFGGFIRGAANPYTPLDGVYYRLTSAGLQGIVNHNGTETSTGIFPTSSTDAAPWVYQNDKKYQWIIYLGGVEAQFWVNEDSSAYMLGSIPLPAAQARICMSGAVPWSVRHAITGGAAGGVMQFKLGSVGVRLGGSNIGTTASTQGNRLYGAYQGLSGGTMGSLALLTNNSTVAAAVPTNTTAALGVGLGGEFHETDTLAVNTDGIICSYAVPAGTVNLSGRRLVLRGVKISSSISTALTGGGYVANWSLAFGHTTVSLATAEGAATKAARRIPIGKQTVASAAAALVLLPDVVLDLGDAPVFVNPGEFVAVVKKKVGTAPSAGSINHLITMIYGWE